jgi:hypothetical protein
MGPIHGFGAPLKACRDSDSRRLPPPSGSLGYAPDPIPNFTKRKIRIENQRTFSVFLFPTLKVDCLESHRIARWHYCP